MSNAIYEELLREVAVDIKTPPGWIPHATAIRVHDTLLALRAEVERLRAVEQAVRKLEETCRDRHLLRHSYLWADLRAALDAIKQEPEKP